MSVPTRRLIPAMIGVLLAACSPATTPPSARTSPTPTATGQPSVEALTAVGNAADAMANTTATFSMTMSGSQTFSGPAAANGSYDFLHEQGTMHLVLGSTKANQDLFFAPDLVYLRTSQSAATATPWLLAAYKDVGALTEAQKYQFLQLECINPGFILEELLWGAVSASAAPKVVVQGHKLTSYWVAVNVGHAQTLSNGSTAEATNFALQKQLVAMVQPVDPTEPTNPILLRVAVDGAGHLAEVTLTPPGTGIGHLAVTFGNYGSAVSVSLPDQSQTKDLATNEAEVTHDGDGS